MMDCKNCHIDNSSVAATFACNRASFCLGDHIEYRKGWGRKLTQIMENNPVMLVKVLPRQYARAFFYSGEVHFSRPVSWALSGNHGDTVRGDSLEGCFAASKELDERLLAFRPGTESFLCDGLIRYRSRHAVELAAFCTYGLVSADFENRHVDLLGDESIYAIISKRFFDEFDAGEQGKPVEESVSDAQAAVLIFDIGEFFKRLEQAIQRNFHGRAIVRCSPVSYVDTSTPHIINAPFPGELFFKDERYSYQHEMRIVIEANEASMNDFFEKNNGNIEMGSMEDIARLEEGYYHQDFYIEYKDGELRYPLSKPVTKKLGPMSEMSLGELIMGYLACADYCARYEQPGVNGQSRDKLVKEILRRTGAQGLRYDAENRQLFLIGCPNLELKLDE